MRNVKLETGNVATYLVQYSVEEVKLQVTWNVVPHVSVVDGKQAQLVLVYHLEF